MPKIRIVSTQPAQQTKTVKTVTTSSKKPKIKVLPKSQVIYVKPPKRKTFGEGGRIHAFSSSYSFAMSNMMPDGFIYPRSNIAMLNVVHCLFGNPRWTEIQRNYEECAITGIQIKGTVSFGQFNRSTPNDVQVLSTGQNGVPVLYYRLDANGPANAIS